MLRRKKKRCKSKNDIIVDCGIKEKNKSKQSWLYQMGENQSKSSSLGGKNWLLNLILVIDLDSHRHSHYLLNQTFGFLIS